MIDDAVIQQFREDVGDDAARNLIGLFVQEARDRIRQMTELAVQDDFEALGREAHALKSSSETYGLMDLGGLARSLEQACREGDIGLARSSFQEITQSADDDLDALSALLK